MSAALVAVALRSRPEKAGGDEAARLQSLEQRLVGGAPGGGRDEAPLRQAQGKPAADAAARDSRSVSASPRSSRRPSVPERAPGPSAPTGTMRDALAEVKRDLAAIQTALR